MSGTRKTRAKRNILSSFSYQLITLICGFVVPKVMLDAFGSELYGATSSITQFLAYITLLEGGVGGVARAALYRPLADNDTEKISRIVREIKGFFRVIGAVFRVYVLIVALNFKNISGLESLDSVASFALVLAISLSTFGQYFIGISNSVLLQAAQRSYVTNTVNIAGTFLNAVSVCLLVNAGCGIITVKFVSSCIFVLRPVMLWLYVRKNFDIKSVKKQRKTYLSQKWEGLGQHIAYFIHSNTDIVVLTCLDSLYSVSVYSVYNMIVSHIQSLTTSFVSGMEALFGDMLAKKEYDELDRTFELYETLVSMVSVILLGVTLVVILPFVKLYTAGVNDASYSQPLLAVFMVAAALMYCWRMPYHALIIAAGHFRQTRAAAYAEAVLNVSLSLILVSRAGLPGVTCATMLATGFRFIYYVVYLSANIAPRSTGLFVKRFTVNVLSVVLAVAAGLAVCRYFAIDSYFMWAVCSAFSGVAAVAVTLAVNFIFYRKTILAVVKKYIPG